MRTFRSVAPNNRTNFCGQAEQSRRSDLIWLRHLSLVLIGLLLVKCERFVLGLDACGLFWMIVKLGFEEVLIK